MAGKSFLRLVAGTMREIFGIQVSTGAANAGDIPALDETGRLSQTMMPVGIGADTKVLPASESIPAGGYVNIWNDSGTAKVRQADATTDGKRANGFILAAVVADANATVYFEGTNNQVTGMTPGSEVFLSTAAGTAQSAAPTGSGNIVQKLGIAVSATEVNFEAGQPVVLA